MYSIVSYAILSLTAHIENGGRRFFQNFSYYATRRHIPENRRLRIQRRENVRCHALSDGSSVQLKSSYELFQVCACHGTFVSPLIAL
jgi:hypothetical protein